MSTLKQQLLGQFRRPEGVLGRIAGQIMARRSSNLERNRWTVDLLDLSPDARVLEIGYGPGVALGWVLEEIPDGEAVGLDFSETMQAAAKRRNSKAVSEGRLKLLVGDVEHPPKGLGDFDAVFATNVAFFWDDPVETVRGLAGHLRPGGRLALTIQPRGENPTKQETEAAADRFTNVMIEAGLSNVEVRFLELDPPATCVTGRR
ncbi:MAG: class I SAM-dependent methyltransferase [Actinomycetia bacterium]|nr:class I SAM-dependent methyltransferase [Actinomycetes bacterium]MCP4958847.1 class I SAM-dependent methyltransferase [Actinomycetes bacterium]